MSDVFLVCLLEDLRRAQTPPVTDLTAPRLQPGWLRSTLGFWSPHSVFG